MEIIKSVLSDNLVVVLAGILFVIVGIAIPKFKMYWLIAGLNGRPKIEIEKYNLRYIEKYFGLFMLLLGMLTIINPILWTSLNKAENIGQTVMVTTLTTVTFMFVFGLVNRRKIYNS